MDAGGIADVGEQADAYNAFFQVWSAHGGSWLKGVEFWQWDLNNKYSPTGYSVMGKPAEAIVSEYFHGGGLAPGLTIPGSPGNDLVDIGRGNDVINGCLRRRLHPRRRGDDLITAGPAAATRLATTTISCHRLRLGSQRRRRAGTHPGQRPAGVRCVRVQAGGRSVCLPDHDGDL